MAEMAEISMATFVIKHEAPEPPEDIKIFMEVLEFHSVLLGVAMLHSVLLAVACSSHQSTYTLLKLFKRLSWK